MTHADNGTPGFDLYAEIRKYNELVGEDISFAFQTIINAEEQEVAGFEALVRGIRKEPASLVISRIPHDQRFAFDQACRIRAIEAAADFGIDGRLHLNCSDIKSNNVGLVAEVISHMARRHKIDNDNIVLELHNLDAISTVQPLSEVRDTLIDAGFHTLADNFGQRDADLRPIALFQPQQLKIAHRLVENIHEHREAQAIVRGLLAMCQDMGTEVIASGVETREEFAWLQDAGINLFQGYFFAQPGMDGE
jgi:EAL domain-containing protein (putative c-di-GMP-specific phosphodiesterase class I)